MAIAKEKLIGMYRTMVRIRTFEERVAREFAAGNVPGFVHLYVGEEAVATGADNDECYVSSNNNLAGLIKANATNDWAFEARVMINQITTAQGVFVGLSEEAGSGVDFMTDDTMAMKVLDSIGFQIVQPTDAAAIWQTEITLNGGARVAVSATAGTAANG